MNKGDDPSAAAAPALAAMAHGNQGHGMYDVVIIGAGFGGLYAARALRREPVRVTVIDRHNHHTFQPLLYQVATAGLSASCFRASR